MAEIRILHVLGGLSLGGAESRIMDLYRNIDRERIQFDFLIHNTKREHFYEEIIELGGKIYSLPKFKVYNYFSYKRAIKAFFKEHHEFAAVQGHMTSTASIYLPIAAEYGIPMTIAHARSAGVAGGLKGIATRLLRRNLVDKTDYCFACSTIAGEAVYGKKAVDGRRVKIIPNAIDASKFVFNPEVREKIRKELDLANKFVIGHVGRFQDMKNHTFLLDIFVEIEKKERDARLMFLGEGHKMAEIKEKAERLNLTDKVLFLGNKSNVSDYFQAMDYFVFPSLYEGLPGTVVEAQAAGMQCLISDTITTEVCFSQMVSMFSLKKTAKEWADYILANRDYKRENTLDVIRDAGFSIDSQVDNMTQIYEKATKKKLMLMVPMLHQGGFERVCVLTARLLEPYYQVFICVFDLSDLAYDIEGLNILHLNLGVKKGKLGKLINVCKRCFAVSKLKKQLRVDVTYSFGPTVNLVNVLTRSYGKVWCGIRSYMDMGNSRMLKLFTGRADKVICCSKVIESELLAGYDCNDIDTLYNPYNKDIICSQAKDEITDIPWKKADNAITLVSMGREDDIKGFWHLVKAFYCLKQTITNARLLIIGDGDFAEYRELSERLGIGKCVLFTGAKKNPFPYLALGDLYVLTSYNEGFPNALVEAMTLGIPVISTNCMTGPAEILLDDYGRGQFAEQVIWGEYGVLVPNMSPEKNLDEHNISDEEKNLATVIEQILASEETYQKYRDASKRRCEEFSYERYVEKIRGYIE